MYFKAKQKSLNFTSSAFFQLHLPLLLRHFYARMVIYNDIFPANGTAIKLMWKTDIY